MLGKAWAEHLERVFRYRVRVAQEFECVVRDLPKNPPEWTLVSCVFSMPAPRRWGLPRKKCFGAAGYAVQGQITRTISAEFASEPFG